MPLADARLLAIDDDKSLAVGRDALASLGGCCKASGPGLGLVGCLDVSCAGGTDTIWMDLTSSAGSRLSCFSADWDCGCSWRNLRSFPSLV